jgi:hypothetical protein
MPRHAARRAKLNRVKPLIQRNCLFRCRENLIERPVAASIAQKGAIRGFCADLPEFNAG